MAEAGVLLTPVTPAQAPTSLCISSRSLVEQSDLRIAALCKHHERERRILLAQRLPQRPEKLAMNCLTVRAGIVFVLFFRSQFGNSDLLLHLLPLARIENEEISFPIDKQLTKHRTANAHSLILFPVISSSSTNSSPRSQLIDISSY